MSNLDKLLNNYAEFGDKSEIIFSNFEELLFFIDEIRADEREACAKVAEEWQLGIDDPRYQADCATAIRARGER